MPTIDDKLNEIDAASERLAALWQEVADLAIAEGHDDIAKSSEVSVWLRPATSSTSRVRALLREKRRPKGIFVTIERRGYESQQIEIVRRTEQQATDANGGRYRLTDGRRVDRRSEWRISDAGLATIRAMPVGENDVSRAFKAAKNGGT